MKRSFGAKAVIYPNPVLIVDHMIRMVTQMHDCRLGGIVNSSPPSIGISLRKSHLLIWKYFRPKAFTINIPSEKYVKEADHFGIKSGKDEDKFTVTKLTLSEQFSGCPIH